MLKRLFTPNRCFFRRAGRRASWWHLLLLAFLKPLEAAWAQAPFTEMRGTSQWRSSHVAPYRPAGWTEPWYTEISTRLDLEANDNINVSQDAPEGDFIIRPFLDIVLGYTLTDTATLRLSVSPGYAKYINHPERDTFVVNTRGMTGLNLDFHVSRTRINFHSEFSLEDDPVSEGEVSDQSNYRRFINITGFLIEPEYETLQLSFGYDHVTRLYSGSLADENRSADSVFAGIGRHVGEATLYRLEIGGSYLSETPGGRDEGFTCSVSLGASSQVSEYLHIQAEVGYGGVQFSGDAGDVDTDEESTIFGNLTLQNRLNEWISQTLRVGSDIVPSVESNFREVVYLTHNVRWSVVRNVSLSSDFFYENSASSMSTEGDDYDRYGVGASVSVQLAKKLESRLGYRFILKESSASDRDYSQNQISLTFTRRF